MNIIEKLEKIKNNSYDKIYHMADIHIRNTDNYVNEYECVFKKLYEYIIKTKTENSLIVIVGDILHNAHYTHISEKLCVDFLSSLNNLLPTILIAGNHDYAIFTENKYDALSTIIYRRDYELNNIYYLRESGIYQFGNIYFGVTSIINNSEKKFTNSEDIIFTDNNMNNIKIGLYHGKIQNCKTNTIELKEGVEIKKFEGYDYLLLGDIHKFQYLNNEKTAAYSSSLISQTFSEIDPYHGVLVWDLKNKTSEYEIIKSPICNFNTNCYKMTIRTESLMAHMKPCLYRLFIISMPIFY
jgi:DNA repair exonuclease SbcCD nuclease subunit